AEQGEPPLPGNTADPARQRTDPADWRNQLRAEQGEPPLPGNTADPARQRTDPADWRNQLRAEQGEPPLPGNAIDPADWRSQLRAEQGEPPLPGNAVDPFGQRTAPRSWQQAEREDTPRGSASYREGNTGDWRRELQSDGDLADGASRRISTSAFVPFKGGVAASVKVPAANSASEGATEIIQRTGARWQDPPDTTWPPRGAVSPAAGTYERRPVSTLPSPSARQNDLLEPDEDVEEDTGGPLAAVGYTAAWYGVPVVLVVLYMLVLNRGQQAHALTTLLDGAPLFGLSLVLSMLVAVGLRRASGSWKAASVGLAAAVMGGGLATVLNSAITGQSLS
ncbi:hypothetical protein AB0B58_13325, partial [Actinoplanes sp. NPDC049118]